MITFQNISSKQELAFLLSENETPLAKCVFSLSPPKILRIDCLGMCQEDLLVVLVRAVLNFFDQQGYKLVTSAGDGFDGILRQCGFRKKTGEDLYEVSLDEYFDSPCCKERKETP